MTAAPADTKGLNIFLFLAKLEQDGIKSSDQNKATILSKLDYQEVEYNKQIADWKAQSAKIATDADKAQKDADKASGGFWSGTFGNMLAMFCLPCMIASFCDGHDPFANNSPKSNIGDQGAFSQDVQNANTAQTKVQQTQQKMSSIENLDLNSQQQNQQSLQNMLNSMLKNFGTMGSFNSRG